MCEVVNEFCNIFCENYNNINNINNTSNKFRIYFNNENTYNIINKIYSDNYFVHCTDFKILNNLKYIYENHNFIFKNTEDYCNKIKFIIVKNNIKFNILNEDCKFNINPYRNIFWDIKNNTVIMNDNNTFCYYDLVKYSNDKKISSIKLIKNKCEYLLDFMEIYFRWDMLICGSIIENIKMDLHYEIIKNKFLNFFDQNKKHLLNFLNKLDNLDSTNNQNNKFKKFIDYINKNQIFNEIFFDVKKIDFYNFKIENSCQYLKFVLFSKYIEIDDKIITYLKSNIFENLYKPSIKIDFNQNDYDNININLINDEISILEKLEQIQLIKNCSSTGEKDPLLLSIDNSNLKLNLIVFLNIVNILFYNDFENTTTFLKISYIYKKSQLIQLSEFNENIQIVNSILEQNKIKNNFSDNSFIYEFIKNKHINIFESINNSKIPQIRQSSNKLLDIYEHQNCYLLLIEQLYLNNFIFLSKISEEHYNIYEKIIKIIIEKLINEKISRDYYLRTGNTKYNQYRNDVYMSIINDNSTFDFDQSKYDQDSDKNLNIELDNNFDEDANNFLINRINSLSDDYFNEDNSIHDYYPSFTFEEDIVQKDNIENIEKKKEFTKLKKIEKLMEMNTFDFELIKNVDIENIKDDDMDKILTYYNKL